MLWGIKFFRPFVMNKPLILKNSIQKYAWGSHAAIQNLLGTQAPEEPWAELWMGAHPKAPSQVRVDGHWIPLDRLIQQFPTEILGETVAKHFSGAIPYLYKVLAADSPLSIQAHPNMTQAREGFERENSLNIPLNAPHRNYKDSRHKPECICALTRFIALKGFRRVPRMLPLLKALCPVGLARELDRLAAEGESGLKRFFNALLTLPENKKDDLLAEAVKNAKKYADRHTDLKWVLRLYKKYPKDIGVLSPVILNLVSLAPGEALFLPSGELHAYLEGFGVELMANSDNVLRGGLTLKHIDPEELLTVVNFTETDVNFLLPENKSSSEGIYATPAKEFFLSVIQVNSRRSHTAPGKHSADILLCTSGAGVIRYGENHTPIPFEKGTAILVPAVIGSYRITGDAVIYKAGVPL